MATHSFFTLFIISITIMVTGCATTPTSGESATTLKKLSFPNAGSEATSNEAKIGETTFYFGEYIGGIFYTPLNSSIATAKRALLDWSYEVTSNDVFLTDPSSSLGKVCGVKLFKPTSSLTMNPSEICFEKTALTDSLYSKIYIAPAIGLMSQFDLGSPIALKESEFKINPFGPSEVEHTLDSITEKSLLFTVKTQSPPRPSIKVVSVNLPKNLPFESELDGVTYEFLNITPKSITYRIKKGRQFSLPQDVSTIQIQCSNRGRNYSTGLNNCLNSGGLPAQYAN